MSNNKFRSEEQFEDLMKVYCNLDDVIIKIASYSNEEAIKLVNEITAEAIIKLKIEEMKAKHRKQRDQFYSSEIVKENT